MALFDDLTKKAAKFTEEAIDKTQEFAGTAKIKLKIKNLESDRDDVYRELGKYYFQLLEDQNSIDAEVSEMRSRIYNFDAEINELKKEIGKNHFLYNKRVWAVAKCKSGNKVLYLTGNEKGEDTYYVFHLTYSEHSTGKFPDYEELGDLHAVKEYTEKCNR